MGTSLQGPGFVTLGFSIIDIMARKIRVTGKRDINS